MESSYVSKITNSKKYTAGDNIQLQAASPVRDYAVWSLAGGAAWRCHVFGPLLYVRTWWRHQWLPTRGTRSGMWCDLVQSDWLVWCRADHAVCIFFTFSHLPLDKSIPSKLQKDRELSEKILGCSKGVKDRDTEHCVSVSEIVQWSETATMAAWRVPKPCFPEDLSTLNWRSSWLPRKSSWPRKHTAILPKSTLRWRKIKTSRLIQFDPSQVRCLVSSLCTRETKRKPPMTSLSYRRFDCTDWSIVLY